jgi:hypothetical protein
MFVRGAGFIYLLLLINAVHLREINDQQCFPIYQCCQIIDNQCFENKHCFVEWLCENRNANLIETTTEENNLVISTEEVEILSTTEIIETTNSVTEESATVELQTQAMLVPQLCRAGYKIVGGKCRKKM